MKVALVVPAPVATDDRTSAPNRMSIAIWAHEVARRLATSVDVVVYHQGGGARELRPTVERHEGVEYVGVPVGIDLRVERLAAKRRRGGARDRFARSSYHLPFAVRAALDARRRGVDVVHVANHPQWITAFSRLLPSARTILHMHSNWLVQVDEDLLRPHLGRVDVVAGVSRYVTEAARRRFADVGARFVTIHNGADVAALSTDLRIGREERADPRFLFVGRASPEKGLHVLVPAFHEVRRHLPDAHLTIVGGLHPAPREFIVDVDPDPLVRDLRRFYDSPVPYLDQVVGSVPEETAARIALTGSIPQAEVHAWYRASSALVFPVVGNETLGMPLAEAMLTGLPVVSTASGGTTEVVDQSTAIVVPRDDVGALADAMRSVVTHPTEATERARRAVVESRRRFSWDRVATDVLGVVRDLTTDPDREHAP